MLAADGPAVLQATAWYLPEDTGGTEIYVAELVKALRPNGIGSQVIRPRESPGPDGYSHEGTVVRTYPVNPVPSPSELSGSAAHAGFDAFRTLLRGMRGKIYHQHSWTRGLGGLHLRAAREAGLRTVLTLHTPSCLCLRGTMMRFGEAQCDGRIVPRRCAACRSEQRGAPRLVARGLGMLPPALSRAAASAVPKGRAGTALAARMLAERRREEFTGMVQNADRIVAVSLWLFEALRRNGVPQEKLVLSRHGVAPDFAAEIRQRRRHVGASPRRPLRLIYLGRLHPVKGVHVAVAALRALPRALPMTLTIHGVGSGAEEREYAAQIYAAAADDPRIVIAPPVSRSALAKVMMEADAIVVPSLWLETGPLVVLEAKAAGLPVIGSRLGGIAELVDEPDDGVLVVPGDVAAWTSAIELMAAAPRPVRRPDRSSPRTMCDVAAEMAELYMTLR